MVTGLTWKTGKSLEKLGRLIETESSSSFASRAYFVFLFICWSFGGWPPAAERLQSWLCWIDAESGGRSPVCSLCVVWGCVARPIANPAYPTL